MNNPFTPFSSANPNGIVKSPKGSRFSRNGNRFFLSYQGTVTELDVPAKAFLREYYREAWYPTLKNESISFATPAETWIKTTAGNTDIGWAKSRAGSSFVRVLSETTPVLGDILAAYAGDYFTYFIKTNGDLYAAGENYNGQLGLGTTSQRETASLVLSNVKKVSSGMYSSFGIAIKNDNTLWGVGYGSNGQWGNGTNDSYNTWTEITLDGDITGSGHVVDVASGEYFAAFLMSDNTLWGAGDDMGIGTNTPIQIDTNVTAIAAGGYHMLYIKDDNTLWAIGDNGNGQLGTGDTNSHNYDDPVQIDTGVKAIGCGGYHSGYIKTDDTLWMVGSNGDGELGLGDTVQRNSSEQVSTNVRSVIGGDEHTIFVKNDNTLWGMGRNNDGQLGVDSNNNDVVEPIQIDTDVSSATVGYEHTLYVKTNKMLYGMGYNFYYNLGDPVYDAGMYSSNATSEWTKIPRNQINVLEEVDRNWSDLIYADGKFVAGGGEGSTVIKYSTDGITWQTASIQNTDAGVKGLAYASGTFVAVTNASDISNDGRPEVYTSTDGITWITGSLNNTNYNELNGIIYGGGLFVAGGDYRIVSSADGVNWNECTESYNGYTRRFAYGNGKYVAATAGGSYNSADKSVYTPSFNSQTASAISVGPNHSMVIKDGILYGCGNSNDGRLGFQNFGGGRIVYFIPVSTDVRSVSCHNAHTTFVKNDNTLWAVGDNYRGQLGDGTTTDRYTPIQVDTNVSESFGGIVNYNTLYIKNDNTLWGIGDNYNSQLADETVYGPAISSSIQIDTNVKCAAYGDGYILYVKTDNTLWGRGNNGSGQLGLGDTTNRTSSVQIATDVVYCAAGNVTSYYLDVSGSLYGMGYNGNGQLGLGDTTNRNTPTFITGSVSKIAAAYYSSHFIASGSEGKIYNSGYNNGWFGRGNTNSSNVPVLSIISGAMDIRGGNAHVYIRRNDDTVWSCGSDGDGVLGISSLVEKGTYSTDGLNWSSSFVPDYNYNDVAFGNGKFVMVADDPFAISSTDGVNWTSSYITTSSFVVPSRIIFDGTKFVSAGWYGNNGRDIYTSTDGVSWTLSTTGQNGDWGALAYGDGKYVVLAGDSGADVNPPKSITI